MAPAAAPAREPAAATRPESGERGPETGDAAPWYRSATPGGTGDAPAGPPPAHPPATARSVADRPRRTAARVATAAGCLVLGLGLLGGAAAGSWLTGDSDGRPSAAARYAEARTAWHSVPVDDLFPRTLHGKGAGPGGADRTWTRIAVAPDSSCGGGFDPLLDRALSPVGCERLLRATYTDETRTSVTTVGILVAEADADGMRALRDRFAAEKLDRRADLIPRTYPAKGTEAAGFGDAQRASWQIHVRTDIPAVVYAVTGFADGREVTEPQAAPAATADGASTDVALSGVGHDARGIAAGAERAFRAAADPARGAGS